MKVTAHPKSNAELTQKMIDAINKQTTYWSDDRNCLWFFDFTVDGIWISQEHIDNAMTECTVILYDPKGEDTYAK